MQLGRRWEGQVEPRQRLGRRREGEGERERVCVYVWVGGLDVRDVDIWLCTYVPIFKKRRVNR